MPKRIPDKTLGDYLTEIEGKFDALDERQKTRNRWLAVLAVGVAVAIGAGWWSNHSQAQAIVNRRTEARLAECHRDNDQADRAVTYAHDQALVLIRAAHANPADPTPAAYIADAERAARKLFPKRSCRPAAIDAYYQPSPTTTVGR